MNEINDDKLIADARKLATEIRPERDLWAGIDEAIQKPARPTWTPYVLQAAALVFVIAGSSGITWYVMKNQEPAVVVQTTDELFANPTAFTGDYGFNQSFITARSTVESKLEQELDRLPPETRAEVEKNLAIIRAAIMDINMKLEAEPDNVLLQELLLKTYREELAVMRKVGGLTNSVMSRNDI